MANLGQLGEKLVSAYLEGQGARILQQRWRCPWGEVDIIACAEDTLIFVEVKTRGEGNWDNNGLLAINPQKQLKISQTAQVFLATFPQWSDYPCRFDVALVRGRQILASRRSEQTLPTLIKRHQPIFCQGYELTLIEYLSHAFDQ